MGRMKEIYVMCMNGDSEETIAKWIMEYAASKPDKQKALELARIFKSQVKSNEEYEGGI
jgi:hypothetical protein